MAGTSLEYRDGAMSLTGYLVDGSGSDPAPRILRRGLGGSPDPPRELQWRVLTHLSCHPIGLDSVSVLGQPSAQKRSRT